MRIGTWNLDGRWTEKHRELLLDNRCDVWLLTEVSPRSGQNKDYHCHFSKETMAPGQHWAAVFSLLRSTPLPDPHPASAAAVIGDVTFCSTILPWRSCGKAPPWIGRNHAEKTEAVLTCLLKFLKPHFVWGGDWNHSLYGPEYAGSEAGRAHLLAAIESLSLQVPTKIFRHQRDICPSIDHIAIPEHWSVKKAERLVAVGRSDHDAYVIETEVSCDTSSH